MQIVLLHDIKGLGRKMDIKNVSNGYARNFLIPQKLAEPATEEALHRKEEGQKREEQLLNELKETAKKIETVTLEFPMTTSEKGGVFGSVTSEDIKLGLKEKGFKDFKVVLEKPLKHLGEHTAEVDMGYGIKGKIKVILRALS